MCSIGTDDFWEDLLDFIEQGKVIPVIGEHAVSFGEGDELLYPWLARELATRLGVSGARLSAMPTLNDVAREHLLAGGERNAIYTRLSRILRERCLVPGDALRDLAGIAAFNLYLTTTFDPLLERALNTVRFAGVETTRTQAFFPSAANKDLPARRAELAGVTVYHVLGKVLPSVRENLSVLTSRAGFMASTPFSVSQENSIRMAAMCCLTVGGAAWRCKVSM